MFSNLPLLPSYYHYFKQVPLIQKKKKIHLFFINVISSTHAKIKRKVSQCIWTKPHDKYHNPSTFSSYKFLIPSPLPPINTRNHNGLFLLGTVTKSGLPSFWNLPPKKKKRHQRNTYSLIYPDISHKNYKST